MKTIYCFRSDIVIKPETQIIWASHYLNSLKKIWGETKETGKDLTVGDLSEKNMKFRINSDGTGIIFILVEKLEKAIRLNVKRNEWSFRSKTKRKRSQEV